MQFPWFKQTRNPPPSKEPKPTTANPLSSFHSHIHTFADNVNHALRSALPQFSRTSPPSAPPLAWLSPAAAPPSAPQRLDLAMSTEAIEEQLAGVPVYALSNSAEEFVLVSGARTMKRLGLFCFRQEDAEALLNQMRSMDEGMGDGSKVVAVALNKVFQLKVDGVALRFVPDASQVANAIKEKEKAGELVDDFSGVPVFQSRSLALRSQNKRYRPVFFRKEDLEDSLLRASRQQRTLNPSFRQGDIQVCTLEDIISAMREGSSSKWDDVVFIPPGFNVSTDLSETAQG